MTSVAFVKILKSIVNDYDTLYVLGGIGQPLTTSTKSSLIRQYKYNAQPHRKNKINRCDQNTYAFDCVGLIKSVLWGWTGNKNFYLGGAIYQSNGIDDIGADTMITRCRDVSTDFSVIASGEAVWMNGHIGVYIGNNKVIECSPAFADKVQVTKLSQRKWLKHGKLPTVTYAKEKKYSGEWPTLPKVGYLKQGDKGEEVVKLQRFLNWYGNSLEVDGDYGTLTKSAVYQFQRKELIEIDGIFGKESLKKAKTIKK